MRFLLQCSFNGLDYQGWQKQPGQPTVQETLEKGIATLLRNPSIQLVGCGRTDRGVHASKYFAHFDHDLPLASSFCYHLNAILPESIAVQNAFAVQDAFHARYDAYCRTYEYDLHGFKSPFINKRSFQFKHWDLLVISRLQQAADVLKDYDQFFPFCLSDSGLQSYKVVLHELKWESLEPKTLKFTISANRFLRGMVRLVTGMCINVSIGKINEQQVRHALTHQVLLPISLSLPPHGLSLVDVKYTAFNTSTKSEDTGDIQT